MDVSHLQSISPISSSWVIFFKGTAYPPTHISSRVPWVKVSHTKLFEKNLGSYNPKLSDANLSPAPPLSSSHWPLPLDKRVAHFCRPTSTTRADMLQTPMPRQRVNSALSLPRTNSSARASISSTRTTGGMQGSCLVTSYSMWAFSSSLDDQATNECVVDCCDLRVHLVLPHPHRQHIWIDKTTFHKEDYLISCSTFVISYFDFDYFATTDNKS